MKPLPRSAIRLSYIFLLILAGSQMASAATSTWNLTSGTGTWSTPGNWGGGLPGTADTALFQNNTNTNQTLTANVDADTTVSKVQVQTLGGKSGTIDAKFTGTNTLTVTSIALAAPTVGGGTNTIDFQTNLTLLTGATRAIQNAQSTVVNFNSGYTVTGSMLAPGQYVAGAGGGTINFNSSTFNAGSNNTALRVDGGTVNWNVGTFTSSSTNAAQIQLSGVYATSTAVTATLNFLRSYSSGGGITLGYAANNSNLALYGTANNVTIAGNMTVAAAGTGGASVNTITLGANDTAATSGSPSTVTFTGGYAITDTNARTHQFSAAANNTAIFSGVISGGSASGSAFTKIGAGTVEFSGTSANTYNSAITTEVVGGTLLLQKSANVVALNSSSVTVDGGATLQLGAAGQISGTSALSLAGGTFDLQGNNQTLGSVQLTGNGSISGSGGTLTTTSAYDLQSGTASAKLAGSVALNKTSANTVALSGVNTYTGDTTVSVGTLLANTAVSGTNSATGTGTVSVSASAILGGSGQITPGTGKQISVANGGIIAPGVGLGTLTLNGANTTSAVLALASGAIFAFELNSTGPGNFQSDKIALLNGAANDIVFGGSNVINFTDLSSGSLAHGAYTLFTADIASAYSGFGNLSIGTGLGAYTGSTLQVVGNNIMLNVVPEPTTWALLAFSLTTVMVMRRRRD